MSVATSEIGTKRTWRDVRVESGLRSKADICSPNDPVGFGSLRRGCRCRLQLMPRLAPRQYVRTSSAHHVLQRAVKAERNPLRYKAAALGISSNVRPR
jgi:hypothetical protein